MWNRKIINSSSRLQHNKIRTSCSSKLFSHSFSLLNNGNWPRPLPNCNNKSSTTIEASNDIASGGKTKGTTTTTKTIYTMLFLPSTIYKISHFRICASISTNTRHSRTNSLESIFFNVDNYQIFRDLKKNWSKVLKSHRLPYSNGAPNSLYNCNQQI